MTGYINSAGYLFLKRKTTDTKQVCIFAVNAVKFCGDFCPHFREPRLVNNRVNLQLCFGRTITFTDFKDERK